MLATRTAAPAKKVRDRKGSIERKEEKQEHAPSAPLAEAVNASPAQPGVTIHMPRELPASASAPTYDVALNADASTMTAFQEPPPAYPSSVDESKDQNVAPSAPSAASVNASPQSLYPKLEAPAAIPVPQVVVVAASSVAPKPSPSAPAEPSAPAAPNSAIASSSVASPAVASEVVAVSAPAPVVVVPRRPAGKGSLLTTAAKQNDLKLVQSLLKSDKNLPCNDLVDGLTALHWAIRHYNHKMVELLVKEPRVNTEAKGDPEDGIMYSGTTPLLFAISLAVHWKTEQKPPDAAAEKSDWDMALIIASNREAKAESEHERALYFAVKYNQLKLAQTLLEGRAKIEARDVTTNDSLLHLAAKNSSAAMVTLLRAYGCIPNRDDLNNRNQSVFDIANPLHSRPLSLALVETPIKYTWNANGYKYLQGKNGGIYNSIGFTNRSFWPTFIARLRTDFRSPVVIMGELLYNDIQDPVADAPLYYKTSEGKDSTPLYEFSEVKVEDSRYYYRVNVSEKIQSLARISKAKRCVVEYIRSLPLENNEAPQETRRAKAREALDSTKTLYGFFASPRHKHGKNVKLAESYFQELRQMQSS